MIGRALKLVEEMARDGLLLEWKNKECVSINIGAQDEVYRLIEAFNRKGLWGN